MKRLFRFLSLLASFSLLSLSTVQGQINEGDYTTDGNNKITFLGERQAPNFDFEGDWQDKEPWGWNSSACFGAGHSASSFNYVQSVWQSTETRPGSQGRYSMQIKVTESDWYHYQVPFGTRSYEQMGTLTTGRLYYYDDKGNSDSYIYTSTADGEESYRWSFTGRPDSIVFWAWSKATLSGRSNLALYLHNNSSLRDKAGSTSNGTVIGSAVYDIPNTDTWVRYSFPINYNSSLNPEYLLLSFTAGPNFRYVENGDQLYVDDVLFIYNNQTNLRSQNNFSLSGIDRIDGVYVRHGGTTQPITITYNLSGTMSPFLLSGGNDVIAQLSDKNGSFDNPRNIGSVKSNRSGSFTATIPADLPDSKDYKLRLISTDYPDTTNAVSLEIYREWTIDAQSDSRYGVVYGGETYRDGTVVTLIANPKPETCLFLGWREEGAIVYEGNYYSFTVDRDRTITALFDTLYKLEVENIIGASVHFDNTLSNHLTVRAGNAGDTTAKLHLVLSTGYGFYGFEYNGDTIGVDDPGMHKSLDGENRIQYNYDMPITGGGTIKPLVDTLQYECFFIVSPLTKLGSIAGAGLEEIAPGAYKGTYKHFTSIAATAIPASSYSNFQFWQDTLTGTTLGTDEVLNLQVSGQGVYRAVFQEVTHRIEVSVAAGQEDRGCVLQNGEEKADSIYSAFDPTTIRLQAVPQKGYAFTKWTVVYNSATKPDWGAAFADTLLVDNGHLDADYILVANFDTSRHNLVIEKPNDYLGGQYNNGFVSGAGIYKYGDSVLLTATADSGYHFVRWESNGQAISGKDSVGLRVFSDTLIRAVFAVDTVELVFDVNDVGLGELNYYSGKYPYFLPLEIVGSPKDKGEFRYWVINGDTLSVSPVYNLTAVRPDTVLGVFSYRRCRVEISAEPEANGVETCNGETTGGIFEYGSRVEFNAVPFSGYDFAGWRTPQGDTIRKANFVIESLTTDTTLVALFPPHLYHVKVRPRLTGVDRRGFAYVGEPVYDGDTVYGINDTAIYFIRPAEIHAIAKEGYEFQGWYDGTEAGSRLLSTAPKEYFLVRNDTTIYAWFRDLRIDVNLTAIPDMGGVLKGSGRYLVNTKINIEAVANPGYTFLGWYQDTIKKTGESKFEYKVTSDIYWIARFREKTASLTLKASPEEAASALAGEGEYRQDYNARLYVEPAEGYELEYWVDKKGEYLSSDNPYLHTEKYAETGTDTVTALMQPVLLSAEYRVEPTLCGRVEAGEYRWRRQTSAHAVPAYGYAFSRWESLGGENLGTDSELRFTGEKDTAFKAVFEPLMFRLSIVSEPEGGAVQGTDNYPYLHTASLWAKPAENYVFSGWYNASGEVLGVDTVLEVKVRKSEDIEARFEKSPAYSLISVEPGVAGFVWCGNERVGDTLAHRYNETLVLEAAPGKGYAFRHWRVRGESGEREVGDLRAALTLQTGEEIAAVFDTAVYTVQVEAENGRVEGAGEVRFGNAICLKAVADEGYVFESYRDAEGRVRSYDAEYCFYTDSSVNIKAFFDNADYRVEVGVSEPEGFVSGAGVYRVGDEAELSAWTMDLQKTFSYWSSNREGSDTLSEEPVFLYRKSKAGNDTLYAFFVAADARLVLETDAKKGTVKGGGNYVVGRNVAIDALARTGYHFAGWYENGFLWSETADTTVSMDASRTLSARFEPDTLLLTLYAQSLSKSSAREAELHGGGTYLYGQTAYIEITDLPSGYAFGGWRDESTGKIFSTSTATTRVMNTDMNITALLEPLYFEVSARTTGNGEVVGTGSYAKTEERLLRAIPAEGWRFAYWELDGKIYAKTDSIRLAVNADIDLEAVFEWDEKRLSPNVSVAEGGGVYTLVSGGEDETILRAVPNPGYEFAGWSLGDSTVSTSREYASASGEVSDLVAHFKRGSYQLRFSVNLPEGAVSISGTGSYRYGQEAQFGITLKEGYGLEGWYIDGKCVSTAETDVIIMTGNVEIEARVVRF